METIRLYPLPSRGDGLVTRCMVMGRGNSPDWNRGIGRGNDRDDPYSGSERRSRPMRVLIL